MREKQSCVYGPVASRRLGSSLGLDLVPRKTCDYDCIYCQLGRTTLKTTRRVPYVPADRILDQLGRRLKEIPRPDYITVSGCGEPTLNSELGRIITGARQMSESPLAVITNGSLLGNAAVAGACMQADLVIPSLDAADEKTFQRINRPCRELHLQKVVDGLASFREQYRGDIWLEVFIVDGVNSSEEQMDKLSALIKRIRPDKVQLNTAVRPTAEPFACPVESGRLEELASLMGMGAEVIEPLRRERIPASRGTTPEKILQLLKRRPCTADELSLVLGINYVEASKELAEMEESGLLSSESRGGTIYYYAR